MIDGFDPASVEHGELKARMSSMEERMAGVEQKLRSVVTNQQNVEGVGRFLSVTWIVVSGAVNLVLAAVVAFREKLL